MGQWENGKLELSSTLTNTLRLACSPAGARAFSLTSIRGKMVHSTSWLVDRIDGFKYDKYLSCLLLQIATVLRKMKEWFPFQLHSTPLALRVWTFVASDWMGRRIGKKERKERREEKGRKKEREERGTRRFDLPSVDPERWNHGKDARSVE